MFVSIVLFLICCGVIGIIAKSEINKGAMVILVITTLIVLFLMVTCNEFGFESSGKRYVTVSGYYRDNGVYVNSYERSYPGEKNKSAGTSYAWIYLIGIIIVIWGGLIWAKIRDDSKNINKRPGGLDGTGGSETYYKKSDSVCRTSSKKDGTPLKAIVEEQDVINVKDSPLPSGYILNYNARMQSHIIDLVSYSTLSEYDLESILISNMAHELYDFGCPYVFDELERDREYIYNGRIGNKNGYCFFTYSSHSSRTWGHDSRLYRDEAIKKILDLYGCYLSIHKYTWSKVSIDLVIKGCERIPLADNEYPEFYSNGSWRKCLWKESGLPCEYGFIQVKDIYRPALKHCFKKVYDELQEELQRCWTIVKKANGYTIYRTKRKWNVPLSNQEIDLINKYDLLTKKLKSGGMQPDDNSVQEIYRGIKYVR